jgi:hypothetical protein
MNNTTLMNFRAPNQIKSDFNHICKLTRTTMTSEIVRFMMEFISEGNQKIKFHKIESNQSTIDPTVERYGNLIKDPSTSTWVTADEWNNNYGL